MKDGNNSRAMLGGNNSTNGSNVHISHLMVVERHFVTRKRRNVQESVGQTPQDGCRTDWCRTDCVWRHSTSHRRMLKSDTVILYLVKIDSARWGEQTSNRYSKGLTSYFLYKKMTPIYLCSGHTILTPADQNHFNGYYYRSRICFAIIRKASGHFNSFQHHTHTWTT